MMTIKPFKTLIITTILAIAPFYLLNAKDLNITESVAQNVYDLVYSQDSMIKNKALDSLLDTAENDNEIVQETLIKALFYKDLNDTTLQNIWNILSFLDSDLSFLSTDMVKDLIQTQKTKTLFLSQMIEKTYDRFRSLFDPLIKTFATSESPLLFSNGLKIIKNLQLHAYEPLLGSFLKKETSLLKIELTLTTLNALNQTPNTAIKAIPYLGNYSAKIRYQAILLLSSFKSLQPLLQDEFKKTDSLIAKSSIIEILGHYHTQNANDFIIDQMSKNRNLIPSISKSFDDQKLSFDQVQKIMALIQKENLLTRQIALLSVIEKNYSTMDPSTKTMVVKNLKEKYRDNKESLMMEKVKNLLKKWGREL